MSRPVFHPGERAAQRRYDPDWSDAGSRRLERIIGDALDERMARFAESRHFFFLATADADGRCDCSFKGSETDEEGRPLPAVWVRESRRLLFPDYAGNRLFNSLGNLLSNPHLGMIFIDFAGRTRLRVNGRATILETGNGWRERWPQARRAIEVNVDQAYWNCSRYIPTQP